MATELAIPRLSEPLKLWERLEIVVGDDRDGGRYVSRIEDFLDDRIVIDQPEFLTGNVLLTDNCDVSVLVTRKDAVYRFHSTLTKDDGKDHLSYSISKPTKVQRLQRRMFFRVDLLTKVNYSRMSADNSRAGVVEFGDSRSVSTINVSGGGMLLNAPAEMSPDDLLLLKVQLFAELKLPETVLGICRRVVTEKDKLVAGVEFVLAEQLNLHLTKNQVASLPSSVKLFDRLVQNRLVTSIFQKQVEMRGRGMAGA